jgi:hypothetical protein
MSDFQAIADRVEIEALRGEFSDAVMMNDHERLAERVAEFSYLDDSPLAGSVPGPAKTAG